jgi:hypothetical protein
MLAWAKAQDPIKKNKANAKRLEVWLLVNLRPAHLGSLFLSLPKKKKKGMSRSEYARHFRLAKKTRQGGSPSISLGREASSQRWKLLLRKRR